MTTKPVLDDGKLARQAIEKIEDMLIIKLPESVLPEDVYIEIFEFIQDEIMELAKVIGNRRSN